MTVTLPCAVAFITVKHELPFSHYRLIAEWLGCYSYILPDDRRVLSTMIDTLYVYLQARAKSSRENVLACMLLHTYATLAETNMTLVTQAELTKLIEREML